MGEAGGGTHVFSQWGHASRGFAASLTLRGTEGSVPGILSAWHKNGQEPFEESSGAPRVNDENGAQMATKLVEQRQDVVPVLYARTAAPLIHPIT